MDAELWMFRHEERSIRRIREQIEADLNVRIRVLQEVVPPVPTYLAGMAIMSHRLYTDMSYFLGKVIAATFSSFKEVLLLDADQIVLRDPTSLFDYPNYKETGALIWPDYWGLSFDPSLISVLNRARRIAGLAYGMIVKKPLDKSRFLPIFIL